MDTDKIKNLIENSLEGSIADVNGGEGKYTANIIKNGRRLAVFFV